MNMAFGLGMTLLPWIAPQTQAPIRAYQMGRTAYTVGSMVLGIFTGGTAPLLDCAYALATSSQAQCEAARQLCLLHAGGDHWKQTICQQVYERCIASIY